MSSQLTQRDSLDTESELSPQEIVGGWTLINMHLNRFGDYVRASSSKQRCRNDPPG